MRLKEKYAVVTGGGKGIGAAISLALAAEGCAVALAGRSADSLERTAQEVQSSGRETLAIACDVTDPAAVHNLFRQVQERWGWLDILVNNAGQSHSELVAKLSLEDWRRMLDVNLTGTFLCSQEALRMMLPRRSGRIINIASIAAQMGFRYAGAYVAAKHGVLGLTRTMALETALQGITVNAVCPGWVDSEMFQRTLANISAKTGMSQEKAREALARESPQNRIIQPAEVASAVVWLACDEARGITGQAINISGGQLMS